VLPTVTLVHISDGKGQFRSHPSGVLPVARNTVMFVHPQVWHAYRPDPETGWMEQWIEFAPEAALPLMRQSGVTPEAPLKCLDVAASLTKLFQELLDLARTDTFGMEHELAAGAYRILAHVLTLWQSHEPHAQHYATVERMRQFLVSDPGRGALVTEAADKAGLSVSRLRTLFKQATGLSPKQYQLEARISRASRLLSDSSLPVGIIAEQTGFESVYHFSRQFKRMRGLSPVHYRSLLAKQAHEPEG
jgi:AraC-like DNA-binding protein